ncbi:MAG: hypothetical protein V1492_03025 [Candidatus Micrarchaeota archaeon]
MAFLEKLKKAVSISRPLFWLGPLQPPPEEEPPLFSEPSPL